MRYNCSASSPVLMQHLHSVWMMVKKVRSYKVISLMHKLKAAKVIPSSIVPNYENPYRVSLTFLNRLCTNIPF
ncbi:hypothetical protein pipiens_008505 [Culex pipiens pipiens]|uniref:Uncharacterized protein n=1 Tax=Culex pipiens pipiens TaxID=38569 RepID=A0ABD1DHJ2_CULPP